jgi:nucleotide-binding universal stress UspA family protein
MGRKIVVGYRRDRHGEDALALARLLAASMPVEEVLVVEAGRRSGAAELEATTEAGWPPKVRVTAQATADASAADALASIAEAEHADLVVLGSTHRGFAGRILVGTTAGSLLKESTCTVSIAPPKLSGLAAPLKKVGVAVDGSDGSRAALAWARELAASSSASLRLIGVVEPPPPPIETWGEGVPGETWASGLSYTDNRELVDVIRERVQRDLTAAAASAGLPDSETLVVAGDTVHALRETAEDVDMLVVGSHGHGRVAGAVLGSVSRALANSCPVPLTVVPLPRQQADGSADAVSAAAP